MKINEKIKLLEVYYDGGCGMCRRFMRWYREQEHAVEVVILAYDSDEARERFPEIGDHEPSKLMVTRTDDGAVFRGAESWALCLWAIQKYRWLARRMTSPVMLPLAQKICVLIAANRLKISKLLFGADDKKLAAEIEKLDAEECEDGSCHLEDEKE